MVLVRLSPIVDWTLDQDHVRVAENAELTAQNSRRARDRSAKRTAQRVPSALCAVLSVCRPKGGPCKKHLRVLRVLRGGALDRGAPEGALGVTHHHTMRLIGSARAAWRVAAIT